MTQPLRQGIALFSVRIEFCRSTGKIGLTEHKLKGPWVRERIRGFFLGLQTDFVQQA
jgi:hypothetical protein